MITFNSLNTTKSQTQNNNARTFKPALNIRAGLKQDRVSFSSSKNPNEIPPEVRDFAEKIIKYGKSLIEKGEALLNGNLTGAVIDMENKTIHHFENSERFQKTSFRIVPEITSSLEKVGEGKVELRETHHRPDGTEQITYVKNGSNQEYLSAIYHDIDGKPRMEFKLVPSIFPMTRASGLTVYKTDGNKFLSYGYNSDGQFKKTCYGDNNQIREVVDFKDQDWPHLLRKQLLNGEISNINFDKEQIVL